MTFMKLLHSLFKLSAVSQKNEAVYRKSCKSQITLSPLLNRKERSLIPSLSGNEPLDFHRSSLAHFTTPSGGSKRKIEVWFESMVYAF